MLLAVINTLWICFISLDLVQSYNIHASIYSAFLRIRKITSILGSWTWWKDLKYTVSIIQFSSVQSLSRVWLFATPWIAACQDSLSITSSRSSLKLMSIKSVMPSSHLILCHPLFCKKKKKNPICKANFMYIFFVIFFLVLYFWV